MKVLTAIALFILLSPLATKACDKFPGTYVLESNTCFKAQIVQDSCDEMTLTLTQGAQVGQPWTIPLDFVTRKSAAGTWAYGHNLNKTLIGTGIATIDGVVYSYKDVWAKYKYGFTITTDLYDFATGTHHGTYTQRWINLPGSLSISSPSCKLGPNLKEQPFPFM